MIAVFVTLVLLVGLAAAVFSGQTRSRRELLDRFQIRATIASHFLAGYVRELAQRELNHARAELAGPEVTQERFETVVRAAGLDAAVLLDSDGRLLMISPYRQELLGTNLATRYGHLADAVAGRVAVSGVVPSAAEALPVVAVAVPFDTPSGRRVFSGATAIATTAIGRDYVRNLVPIRGAKAFLVDRTGATVVSSTDGPQSADVLSSAFPELAAAVSTSAEGYFDGPDGREYFVSEPIAGTPWRVVLAAPEENIVSPVTGFTSWVPWLILAALIGAVAALVFMFQRVARAEHDRAQVKDRVLSHVSHELRTPIAVIYEFTTILLDRLAGELTDDQRRYLGIILRNVAQLRSMVRDLLDAARAEVDKLSIEPILFDVTEVASAVVEQFAGVAAEKRISLRVEGDLAPALVRADPARVEQIVSNLVGNALKFTPEGGAVDIAIEAGTPTLSLQVRDNGPGIPPGDLERVFDRLYQSPGSEGAARAGLGLGLFICRELAERQGGSLRAESEPGAGSRFVLQLPSLGAQVAPDAATLAAG